jgi:hypothetical protein
MLRISGVALDVEAMLAQHPLRVNRVWKKGEPRGLKGQFHAHSGASVIVSDAAFDQFDLQVTAAGNFLELHCCTITDIVAYPGVEEVMFDFGIALCKDSFVMSSYLPPKFVQLAANAEVGVMLSHYVCSDNDDDD